MLQSMGLQRIRHDWATEQQQYSIVYVYYILNIFFMHLSVSGHLGCFRVLSIVDRAAVNTEVHVSFRIIVLYGYMPRNGVAGS